MSNLNAKEYFKDWTKVIDYNVFKDTLSKVVSMSHDVTICPKLNGIFKAFTVCNYNDLKIVMIGQNPYPQKDIATGILFANKSSTLEKDISPSLRVIKESAINYEIPHDKIEFDNSMESWAKQGILMINSSLTVELYKPGSHFMIWRQFIICLLKHLSYYNPGLIYVLFGNQAQSFSRYISSNNTVINVKHPAYYARINEKMPYSVFIDINKEVYNKYGTKIKWFNN